MTWLLIRGCVLVVMAPHPPCDPKSKLEVKGEIHFTASEM